MSMELATEIELIRTGKLSQFAPPIRIPAMQVGAVAVRIRLPQLCSNLWWPPTIVTNGAVTLQPAALVLGIQIGSQSAPVLPWGLQGNNVASFTGPVEEIWVTTLSGSPADVYLLGARGIGVAYSGGLTAAGTPSASPAVGGAGNVQS